MCIDPALGKPLLEPLFRLQASPDYGVQYAAGDLGMSHKDDRMKSYITFHRIKLSQCLGQQVNPPARNRMFVDQPVL